jgi:hypothetical protein
MYRMRYKALPVIEPGSARRSDIAMAHCRFRQIGDEKPRLVLTNCVLMPHASRLITDHDYEDEKETLIDSHKK